MIGPEFNGQWSRTITANLFLWMTVSVALVAIVATAIAVGNGGLADITLALLVTAGTIVLLASLSRYRVTVDRRGLRVVSSLLRIPLKRIPLDEIETASAAELVPMEWGGWGYRVMPGRSALILHKGAGLVVTLINSKQFALTLDHPEVPAALLATLRDERSCTARAGN